MNDAIRLEILARLKRDYAFPSSGNASWLRGGKCPSCKGRELYINAEKPSVLRCGRLNKCGAEWSTRELYDDLFDNWSDRYKQTPDNPNAAAKAYLQDARGLNIIKLAGAYAQEYYHDGKTGQGSATVRFAMPRYGQVEGSDSGWWERIIDRPQRFGKKKANMPYGWKYAGNVWHHPAITLDELASASEIWFEEGIFDAIAMAEAFSIHRPHARAVSTLSTNNYPSAFLEALGDAVAAKGSGAVRPTLVFAFDVGAAGVSFTRKFVERARQDRWQARAAQVRPDGEGSKLDWNDLHQRGDLTHENLEAYLENGDITIAETAAEKAFLLYRRSRRASFPFTFKTRQLWATFSAARISELIAGYDEDKTLSVLSNEEKWDRAARESVEIAEICNCLFRALYYQRDLAIDESSYYLRIDFPGKQESVKANFSGSALAAGAEFKKRLISVAPGGIYSGSTYQLDKLMERQLDGIRTVDALYFSGYSIKHGAWMFDEIAVSGGRVIPINDEDYFEIGKVGVKPHHASGEFCINHDPNAVNFDWWADLWAAFGPLGAVSLAYWFLSLFAEQIRRDQQRLGFLEISGEPGSGKTTLLIFLWKLVGRMFNYEGFDPATATAAGIARELVKYGNLPVVMLEGDRKGDSPHQKRFEWNELKKLYNGHSPRTRGVANAGTDTFSPRFIGSLIIAQNAPIKDAEEAVLERIMGLHVDKSRFSQVGKLASERLERLEVEDVSGWIIAMIRQEEAVLKYYHERFAVHERKLLAHPEVLNGRLAFNHAQLAAALDCLVKAMSVDGRPVIGVREAEEAQRLIADMCVERHAAVKSDHPIVAQFWENFDFLDAKYPWRDGVDPKDQVIMQHSRSTDLIAVHLTQFEQKSAENRIQLPAAMIELKKHLVTSKRRKFVKATNVNSRTGIVHHCWVFQKAKEDMIIV